MTAEELRKVAHRFPRAVLAVMEAGVGVQRATER